MKFKNDIEAQARINIGTYSGVVTLGDLSLREDTTLSTVSKSIYVSAQNSGRASIFLDTTAQAGVSQIGFGPTQYAAQNTSGSIEYTNSSSTLVIKTNYQTAITIDSDRNVGIGTTNPQAQLNVVAGSTVRTWTPASGTSAIFESSDSSRAFVSIVGVNQSELLFGDAGSQTPGRVRYNHSDNKLSLWANGNQHVTVDNTGNVGIGTDNPGAKLEVYGSSPNILINNTAETDSGIVFTDAQAGTTQRAAIKFNSSDQKLKFFVNDEVAQRMVIDTAGNVGIGATNPSYQLQLSTNSAAKPSSSTWTVVSDERVKENIKPYEKGLNEILQVNTKTFDYNGKAGFDKIKDNVGIIAQDMIKIFPETIKTYNAKLNETDEEETELYNFDGHALTFALINAVKELKAEIEELKKQINK